MNDPNQVNTFHGQWNWMKVMDNVLYKVWETENKQLQFVAPISTQGQIMQQVHDNPTSGHLGRKTFTVW